MKMVVNIHYHLTSVYSLFIDTMYIHIYLTQMHSLSKIIIQI